MKKQNIIMIAILLVAMASLAGTGPQPVNRKMRLRWDANPAADFVTSYNVYLSQSNTIIREVSVATNEIMLTNIFLSVPNGVYQVFATAVSEFSGLESGPSDAIAVFWYGQPPHAPINPIIDFP
jgi:hypothetical protein